MKSLPVPGLRTGDTVPSFAVAPDGTLYATWQDVRFSNGKRNDVLVTASHDEGQTWSMPVKANDTPAGAEDAFMPAVAVRGWARGHPLLRPARRRVGEGRRLLDGGVVH